MAVGGVAVAVPAAWMGVRLHLLDVARDKTVSALRPRALGGGHAIGHRRLVSLDGLVRLKKALVGLRRVHLTASHLAHTPSGDAWLDLLDKRQGQPGIAAGRALVFHGLPQEEDLIFLLVVKRLTSRIISPPDLKRCKRVGFHTRPKRSLIIRQPRSLLPCLALCQAIEPPRLGDDGRLEAKRHHSPKQGVDGGDASQVLCDVLQLGRVELVVALFGQDLPRPLPAVLPRILEPRRGARSRVAHGGKPRDVGRALLRAGQRQRSHGSKCPPLATHALRSRSSTINTLPLDALTWEKPSAFSVFACALETTAYT